MVGQLLYGYRDGKAVPLRADERGNLRLSTEEIDAMRQGTPMDFEQFTAEQMAEAVSLNPPTGATRAVVQATGGTGLRWRQDGQDPTAQIGMRIEAGAEREFIGNLGTILLIGEGENSSVGVSYYG